MQVSQGHSHRACARLIFLPPEAFCLLTRFTAWILFLGTCTLQQCALHNEHIYLPLDACRSVTSTFASVFVAIGIEKGQICSEDTFTGIPKELLAACFIDRIRDDEETLFDDHPAVCAHTATSNMPPVALDMCIAMARHVLVAHCSVSSESANHLEQSELC